MIGGNITALIQVKDKGTRNKIGELEHVWTDVASLYGWLDYSGGQSDIGTYDAKIQETTHIFLCDYQQIEQESVDMTSDNARMVIGGNVYQILQIDDPMELHQHLEIFLKYVGGGLGVS